jgi:anti-sigma factor RsiW
MNRPDITEGDLHAFIDDALSDERRLEVENYLAERPEAARRVESYRRQRDELRAAFAPAAAEPIPERLNLARMVEARSRSNKRQWQAVAAALALVVFGAAGGWSIRRIYEPVSGAGISALAQEAADSFVTYTPDRIRPVEVREQPEMLEWASNRLKRPVAAPDLTAEGYRFMGGRLVATGHGCAVLFMYDDDHGSRLVFLSRPMIVDQNAPMEQHGNGRIAEFAWSENGIGYSIVGQISSQLLERIAGDARRQLTQEV